jgi:hypothetical protein
MADAPVRKRDRFAFGVVLPVVILVAGMLTITNMESG